LKQVLDETAPIFPKPILFPEARLNFAENLLFPASDPSEDSIAVIEATEGTRDSVSWKQLRERVRICAATMKSTGLQEGDRVAGYLANHTNTVVAMLAASSIGALWTGVSPDTGVHAVLERLKQIDPKILFSDNAVVYNSKTHETHSKILEVIQSLPTLQSLVIFSTVPGHLFDLQPLRLSDLQVSTYETWTEAITTSSPESHPLTFTALPPDHPVYILYSSGTTGAPKCIVHGALGTLLQHKKEHAIQCDIRPGEKLFYFTTCTWMMWHWLVSGLASGATVILYDGSPFRPLDSAGNGEMAMPKLIEELGIEHFGTSAKYLSVLEQKSIFPKKHGCEMKALKAVYSTGSPLAPSTFEYVYKAFGPDLLLGSITGGTDIVSLFGAPCPLLPVHRGEIQCRGLGMAVEAWDHEGNNLTDTGEPGDLVCTTPFPCQPVMFWPPGPTGEARYKKSYFETYPGVWHHGDFIRINPKTGGIFMLGRSDGVLKPAGVRFGSSEIYNVLLKHFSEEVEDSLCIGRRREADTDETVVLFVKMATGKIFDDTLRQSIQGVIRKELSARHVPKIVDECPEIPITMNGKKIENAVKQILCGLNIKTSASVANVESLEWYRNWSAEHA
jgi:acetoacetyl-CoA synthetase